MKTCVNVELGRAEAGQGGGMFRFRYKDCEKMGTRRSAEESAADGVVLIPESTMRSLPARCHSAAV